MSCAYETRLVHFCAVILESVQDSVLDDVSSFDRHDSSPVCYQSRYDVVTLIRNHVARLNTLRVLMLCLIGQGCVMPLEALGDKCEAINEKALLLTFKLPAAKWYHLLRCVTKILDPSK